MDQDATSQHRALQVRKILFLHFLAQVAFISDATEILDRKSMGRIHHRILFIVDYLPGITVNEMLAVLRVTHQNVRLPLRHLADENYVTMVSDPVDRRQKRLYIAPNGKRLLESLVTRQGKRVARSFEQHTPREVETFLKMSLEMVDPQDAELVRKR